MKTAKTKPKLYIASQLTQKTFIYSALVAFLVPVIGITQSIISVQALSVPTHMYAIHLVLSIVVLPLLVFATAYWLNRATTTKVSRIFTATLVAFMFLMLQTVIDALFTKVIFRQQLGYGDVAAVWNGQWLQFVPLAIALIIALLIVVYVLKKAKVDKKKLPSKTMQTTFVATIIGSFVISTIIEVWHTFVQNNGMDPSDIGTIAAVMALPILITALPFCIILLMTERSLPFITRSFIATVYIVIGVFILVIGGFLMNILSPYRDSSVGILGVLPMIFSFILYASIVVIHKRRKAF
ncbi:MAG TPA: hypothetical protein VFM68_00100 [Candidatus Saccharimonadales bacterium]|nr:hypothetical protein [Candidatus Saccharimonadales bacterium]